MIVKDKIILGVVVASIGIFLELLYLSLGNQNEYHYGLHQGVQFGEKIANSPTRKRNYASTTTNSYLSYVSSNDNYPPALQTNVNAVAKSISHNTTVNYTAANHGNKTRHKSNMSDIKQITESNSRTTSNTEQTSITSALSQSSALAEPKTFVPTQNSDNNYDAEEHGFLALTTEIIHTETSTTSNESGLQKIDSSPSDPGTDPIGSPIPVGDGWQFLFMSAIIYVIYLQSVIRTKSGKASIT